jgi:hypothetical protein
MRSSPCRRPGAPSDSQAWGRRPALSALEKGRFRHGLTEQGSGLSRVRGAVESVGFGKGVVAHAPRCSTGRSRGGEGLRGARLHGLRDAGGDGVGRVGRVDHDAAVGASSARARNPARSFCWNSRPNSSNRSSPELRASPRSSAVAGVHVEDQRQVWLHPDGRVMDRVDQPAQIAARGALVDAGGIREAVGDDVLPASPAPGGSCVPGDRVARR